MGDPQDRLEGVTFVRASFSAVAFADWLRVMKRQLDLMTLLARCQLHAVGYVAGHTCGCGVYTPLSAYPRACCLGLVRSHLLMAELSLSGAWLDGLARDYLQAGSSDLEHSFTEYCEERVAAGLITLTGWCGALHHGVLALACDELGAGRVTALDLRLLGQVEKLAG